MKHMGSRLPGLLVGTVTEILSGGGFQFQFSPFCGELSRAYALNRRHFTLNLNQFSRSHLSFAHAFSNLACGSENVFGTVV